MGGDMMGYDVWQREDHHRQYGPAHEEERLGKFLQAISSFEDIGVRYYRSHLELVYLTDAGLVGSIKATEGFLKETK